MVAAVGVGQNRFRPELVARSASAAVTISSSASSQVMRWKTPSPCVPLGATRRMRIQHAVGRVNAVQILGDFAAQEPAGDRMLGIALNLGRPAVLDRDQHGAGVRTIVRAGGVNGLLHNMTRDSIIPRQTVAHRAHELKRGKQVAVFRFRLLSAFVTEETSPVCRRRKCVRLPAIPAREPFRRS